MADPNLTGATTTPRPHVKAELRQSVWEAAQIMSSNDIRGFVEAWLSRRTGARQWSLRSVSKWTAIAEGFAAGERGA